LKAAPRAGNVVLSSNQWQMHGQDHRPAARAALKHACALSFLNRDSGPLMGVGMELFLDSTT
jgi:hypothetical protein